MLITYDNSFLEELVTDISDIANSQNLLQKKVGKDRALALKKRKNQIEASPNFKAYIGFHIGNPHLLHGDLEGLYGVDINAHTRLVIKPLADDLSAESLAVCDTVILKGMIEYHGDKNEWLIP